jgi:molybdopterin/thiamine biosynthesis adenylyltransferase
MTDWDRVERLIGTGALEQLAQKKVAVIGLGSGGGFVALTLAMSGVGNFVLIDPDVIEPANVVRHVADQRYLGRPKAEAVADLIWARNPQAKIDVVKQWVEDATAKLQGVDFVVVGVDGEQSKYAINDVCRALKLTAIYAGVYEKGEGGDVVLIHPSGDGPCYACWAANLRDDGAEVAHGPALDYGMIGTDGTIAAEPGLWLHVTRVASVQADLALNELLTGQPIHRTYPTNTVILANVRLEISDTVTLPPYGAYWVNIKRDPRCLVCGDNAAAEESSLNLSLKELGNIIEEQGQETENHDGQHKPE